MKKNKNEKFNEKIYFFNEIANIIESLFPLRLKIFILYFFFS